MTKILYYNYFITKKGVRTNASIIPLLDYILSLKPDLNLRERNIYHNKVFERILLNKVHTPHKHEISHTIDSDSCIVTFSRKRRKNPYVSDDGSDEYEQIPENRKVLELATALIIPRKNLILLQKNRHSVSINLIKKYLSEFLSDDFSVEFIPITQPSKFEEIKKSKSISKVEFVFDTQTLGSMIRNETIPEEDSVYSQAVKAQYSAAKSFTAPDTIISFSNGRLRNRINKNKMINFIEFILLIDKNEDSPLKKIKVKYIPEFSKTTEVDLVNDGLKTFDLELTDNGGEHVGNNICKAYYDTPGNRTDDLNINLLSYDLDDKTDFIQY